MKKMIMKKSLLFLLLALMTSVPMFADVAINAKNFPDENFRNYLLTNTDPIFEIGNNRIVAVDVEEKTYGINGYGKDKKLTTKELNNIRVLRLENVNDFTGIEHFPHLYALICTGITAENVNTRSSTLNILHLQGSFKSVDFSAATNLNALKIDAPLTSLNLGGLTHLSALRLDNTNLTLIDLSPIRQTVMYTLMVGIYNPQKPITITPPDPSGTFLCINFSICNSKNTELDFSDFTALYSSNPLDGSGLGLDIIDNSNLTTLTLPTNKAALRDLLLHNNPNLTSLNVDDCTNLRMLSYTGNGFKSVNVTQNTGLKVLECYGNGLTSLDVSKNTELNFLHCQNNMLTSLDLSSNTNLTGLECNNNQLTELNLAHNTKLRTEVTSPGGGDQEDRLHSLGNMYYGDNRNNQENLMISINGPMYSESWIFTPSISLSPQNIDKDYVSIYGRSKLGVQCNTNDGVLTSYGDYTGMTSEGNNYIVVADETNGKTDVHKPNSSINYNYTTGFTGTYDEAKTMEVNIGTSAHGMYIHPETLRGSDNFYSGTLYLEFPVKIPEGVQCYYAKGLDANEDLVGLTEVTGTIPANTAVIVKAPSEYKFFAFNESDETPAAPTDNIIEGTIEGLSVAPGTVLTLGHNVDRSTGEYDNFGFWNYRGNWINPFRAYIPKSSLTAGAKNGFSLFFPEDGTTGIARLTNSDTAEDGTWYTLSGIRLTAKPTAKGIYVNGGKKVVIK